jgi:UDP-2,3-diacylglucosamine pyrophosphatase LpxH
MIVHQFPDNNDITIIPISDVHLGALEHYADEWKSFCKNIEKSQNTYIILVGDLLNNSIRNSVANPFDEVMRPREQKKVMVEQLTPIKDKILCSVSGNHERRTTKDSDVDLSYDIMAKLDIEDVYRQNMCFMKISLGKRKNDGTPIQSYTFAVTHGAGGGIYTGATVNRNERFGNVIEGLDCLVVGHTHKGTISKPSKIVIDRKNDKVSMSHYVVISTTSWLNYGGYAMKKMLLPAHVADPQKIKLTMNQNHKKIETIW